MDVAAGERALVDLLALERELLELEYVRRADALERVSEAVRRLGEQGTTEGLLTRAAAELVAGSAFDRVLVSEVVDGKYTGRAERALHAEAKADCVRAVAEREGFDLAECTAYSDSHTDLPFLEVVGHPVAVNPDRALRRVAAERGWPVLEFTKRHAG